MKYIIILLFLLILLIINLYQYRGNLLEAFNNQPPIIIYYHIAELGEWENIVKEQLDQIHASGLYGRCQEIRVSFLGEKHNIIKYIRGKVKLIYHSPNIKEYEHPTINSLLMFAQGCCQEHYILYIHTKGNSRKNNIHVHNWRRMMMYYLVDNYQKCLPYLETYDTIGCNLRPARGYYCKIKNETHNYHYSGNFWWSKTSYIKTLPYLDKTCNHKTYRWLAESWLLYRLPNLKCLSIQATPEKHLYRKSYDIDYYRKKKKLETVDKKMNLVQLGLTF